MPSNPVPSPGTAPSAAASGIGLVEAVDVFMTAVTPHMDTLSAYLQRQAPGQRITSARSEHVAAAPLLASLLRGHTELASAGTPDAIERGVATLTAAQRLSQALKEFTAAVDDTGRLGFDSGWKLASATLSLASNIARHDKSMAVALVPVRAVLSHGPATQTAHVTAARQQHNAAMLAARTARAQQRAAAATARAAAVHPSRPKTSRGTSPVPLANPQGPAASADVAPQGPAPGR